MNPAVSRPQGLITLILGSSFLPCDESRLKTAFFRKKPTVSNAVYEQKLIRGFLKTKEENERVFVISAPSVGGWPFYSKRLFVNGFSENDYLKTVPYCCLYGFLNFFKGRALKKKVLRMLKLVATKEDPIHIIGCEAHTPYLVALKAVKKTFPGAYSTLIVPDMPEDMQKNRSFFYRFLKRRDVQRIKKLCLDYVDSFFCLTKPIDQKINPTQKPSHVMEGLTESPSKITEQKHFTNFNETIRCVYLGKTDVRNGIEVILQAAQIAPSNVLFDIYGSGDYDEPLQKQNLSNVRFHGFVSPSETPAILAQADVLLSPRLPTGDYLAFSFPSKVLEYIAAYKPIVTYKIPSYTARMDSIFKYPKDLSPESFLDAILEIAHKPIDTAAYDSIIAEYDPALASNIIRSFRKNGAEK